MSAIKELIDSPEYKFIENDIESFVSEKLAGYRTGDAESKTIHDSVWGSVEYSAWEMQIIDSPLFQRLRDINQVGLAMLTYPSARHSRFEHSLGVTSAAKKMCEKIDANTRGFCIPPDSKNAIYLAALLHDIGHCFYSHLSESIYGEFEDFVKLKMLFNEKLERKPKPHEILSFMIINTQSFKKFFFDHIDYPEKSEISPRSALFHDIGKMIIGANIERGNEILSYQTSIINGPFDADKLDYIKRDSFTAGLSLAYDIERLFTKIIVHNVEAENKKNEKRNEKRLVIKFNGVTAIEELTFSKIMLFSYIYYHQKVLITETMIKDYIYGLCSLDIIKNFADFLRYTDSDVLSLATKQEGRNPFPEYGFLDLGALAQNIRHRRLPKRCFEVSQANIQSTGMEKDESTIESTIKRQCEAIMYKCKKNMSTYSVDDMGNDVADLFSIITRENAPPLDTIISDLRDMMFEKALEKRRDFYKKLVAAYKIRNKDVNFTMFDTYIVFPKLVSYGSTIEPVVLGKDNNELMTVNDFVKLDHWAGSFNSNKWRGYVFVTDKIDKTIAFETAERFVLQGKAKLKNPTSYLKGIEG
ncbi:MAG: HD domain-containing protein [Clostridiales Family XIII bacterium]|jgi:HD superfamily phosphohydrolase|nr:HD domain-containing protein [Clostridiales Family XIII bacterium]